jgi:LemA protein
LTWTLIIVAAVFVWAVVIYNRLVADRVRVSTAWSDIDVQLKRRHDLVPKLVDAVKVYAAYEAATIEELTRLRAASESEPDPEARAGLEQALDRRVHRLVAVAEAYPDLKASGQFLDLQQQLTDTENQIQYARRYYNGAVRNLNVRIDSFPDMLVARPLRFRHAKFFELEPRDA